MNTQFAFLTYEGVFSAEIPEQLGGQPERVSLIDVEGKALETVVYTPSILFSPINPDLVHRYDTQDDGYVVSVYERLAEPRLLVPRWLLDDGFLVTQIATDLHGDNGVQKVLDGLTVSRDSYGYLRIQLSGVLRRGDIREPTQRDEVNYLTSLESAMPSSVRFIWTGALGHDDSRHWMTTCQTTRTTEVGVTVTCTGLVERRKDVEEAAEQIAATTRRVA